MMILGLPLRVHGHLVRYGLGLQRLHDIIAGSVLRPLLARILLTRCLAVSRCYLLLMLLALSLLLIFLWTNGG